MLWLDQLHRLVRDQVGQQHQPSAQIVLHVKDQLHIRRHRHQKCDRNLPNCKIPTHLIKSTISRMFINKFEP